jgi:hypothetical protein
VRSDAGYFREEPGAGNPHARIREGEAEWPSYSTQIIVGPRHIGPEVCLGSGGESLHRFQSCNQHGIARLPAFFEPPFHDGALISSGR